MRFLHGALCTAVLTLVIAAFARAPYTPPGSDDARIRFSWRMSIAARESCRPRTPAELDALPVHMRTPEICTRDVARYTLITRVGDVGADTIHLVRGGVKGDRPLFVLEERTLSPGAHRIRVDLERTTDVTEVLATLDTTLVMESGAVQLITLDDTEGRRLVARSPASR
jgi:hypothetical protein